MVLQGVAWLWFCAVVWLIYRAMRQSRCYVSIAREVMTDNATLPKVSVLIPARNEAGNIARCLTSLLTQDYPLRCVEIIVVDDNSGDDTAGIVRQMSASHPRIKLMEGEALPEGWTGKAYACWQAAVVAEGEWLCFVDADTVGEPELLTSAVQAGRSGPLDMLSLEPFQEMGGFAERLVLSCGFFMIAFFMDLRRTNDPACGDATANGQFILIRRAVYEAVGGHAAVRDSVAEDGALARRVKESGFRLAVLGGETLIRTRMYRCWRELWQGLAKNVVDMTGSAATTVMYALLGLVLGWAAVLVPVWAVRMVWGPEPVAGPVAAAVAAVLASTALLSLHIAGARHFKIPLWYGLLFPLGYSVVAAIALDSAFRRRFGTVAWKDRSYVSPANSGAAREKAGSGPPRRL
jgi:chlorobactene glucosyltransferase